jgi:predicted AlkP superfamily phosphohydrolase/phosphomutase
MLVERRVRVMRFCGIITVACALALALSAPSCGKPKATPVARVLVVGADGLEWNVLRPLLASGKCKNLRALMERGAYGHLSTFVPTLSPILWTSIATGKMPDQHGIHGFTDADASQYTSAQRKGRALWNIADEYGLACNVFGWWITWPVEKIRGAMVSGSSSSSLVTDNWKPTVVPGAPDQVWPLERASEVMSIAEQAGSPSAVAALARRIFAVDAKDLGAVEKELIRQTEWSIQADATYFEIAKRTLREHPADLAMIYFGGTDVVAHRFWRYYEPGAFAWPDTPGAEEAWQKISPGSAPLARILATPSGARALSQAIPNYYEWFDEMLGGLIDAAGPTVAVIVCSDHGFHASATDAPNAKFITGHHQDGPPGVVVAAGPGIAHQGGAAQFIAGGNIKEQGDILDIAPTVLALLGIPGSREMPDRADAELLEGRARANGSLPLVATHDEGFRAPRKLEVPEAMQRAYIEKFNGLGYIGMEGSDKRAPTRVDPKTFKPDTRTPLSDGESAAPKKP